MGRNRNRPVSDRVFIRKLPRGMGIVGGWAIGVNKKGEYPSSSFLSSPFFGYLLRSHRMPRSRGQAKAD
ncbi:hypothetical protein HZH66_011062 [Vespula vulgaris]|uniref:Uncharacterized protein n=1 Tax=Vespula vulgaris TaxID=7454 RepID=A0A834MVC8_VESVU|nr:hypothetical protein HZH66_011062 [Vespula vulgaris]